MGQGEMGQGAAELPAQDRAAFRAQARSAVVLHAFLAGISADVGRQRAVSVVARAIRRMPALWAGRKVAALLNLPIYRAHLAAVDRHDPLFFLTHRHYLLRNLSRQERLAAACCHYLSDAQVLQPKAQSQIYLQGGLTVWSRCVDGHQYEIRLTAGRDVAHEGGQSLTLLADGVQVCVFSFSVVPRSVVAATAMRGRAILITRKQLTRARDHQAAFFAAFDRSTAAHLVLAALEGVALARGATQLFGLRAVCHPTYTPELAPHLTAAYCDFWRSLGGVEVSDRSFALSIPMQLRPIEDLPTGRRDRAVARRSHSAEIRVAAQSVMAAALAQSGDLG